MTLPDSEDLRIHKRYPHTEDIGRNIIRLHKRAAAIEEASLWMKRIVELVEGTGQAIINNEKWLYFFEHGWETAYEDDNKDDNRVLTTPELITEFLNQLNEGK